MNWTSSSLFFSFSFCEIASFLQPFLCTNSPHLAEDLSSKRSFIKDLNHFSSRNISRPRWILNARENGINSKGVKDLLVAWKNDQSIPLPLRRFDILHSEYAVYYNGRKAIWVPLYLLTLSETATLTLLKWPPLQYNAFNFNLCGSLFPCTRDGRTAKPGVSLSNRIEPNARNTFCFRFSWICEDRCQKGTPWHPLNVRRPNFWLSESTNATAHPFHRARLPERFAKGGLFWRSSRLPFSPPVSVVVTG